jgi:hypothetical protein
MGTRGQLLLCWRGRTIVIYNHLDSYPGFMGVELFQQLVALLRRFRGNVKEACNYWGNLTAAQRLAYDHEDGAAHPFNQIHAFEDVETALQSTLPLCVSEGVVGLNFGIEFIWSLDFDTGVLAMTAHGGRAQWSFEDIYRGRAFSDKWVLEAEIVAYHDKTGSGERTKPFSEALTSAAVQIQAAARRFLEVSRGLRPGGVLMKLAALRFQRASKLLDAVQVR